MTGQPWFFPVLLDDPACRPYAAVFLAGFFGAVLAASALIKMLDRLDSEDWALYELAQPVETYHCSPSCELRAWDGMAEFVRSGACVGRVSGGAEEIRVLGDKSDRVFEVSYGPGRTDSFHCGPMGWQEARRAAAAAMRYAGRHDYG